MKPVILCVDDERDNLDALDRLFRKKYSVLKALSGPEALSLLDLNPEIALIISDQRMPGMTGVQLLEQSIQTHPNTARILLTGYTDIESVIEAVNSGQIYRYVTKPWDPVDLGNAVERALERNRLSQELSQKNASLERALAELQQLDEAKSNFMILINHELKTPLTSILSFGSLLEESLRGSEEHTYIARVLKSAERLREITDDTLLIVSAQTGKLRIEAQDCSLREIKPALPPSLFETAHQKKQSLVFPEEDFVVQSDLRLLSQVFSRLLQNAVKFSAEQTQITLSAQRIEDQWNFEVRNPGPPIPKEVLDRIKKPFTLNENVMHHSKGMGLGLAVCQSILKEMGSRLDIGHRNGEFTVGFSLKASGRGTPVRQPESPDSTGH